MITVPDAQPQKRILVSVPTEAWIHADVLQATHRLRDDGRYRIQVTDGRGRDGRMTRPYTSVLNRIVRDLLDGPADYWLNIDSDNPPLRNPLNLVELDLDIVGCPTPMIKIHQETGDWLCWNAVDWSPDENAYREHPEKAGLQEVDAVGSGCMLVARRVLEHPEMRPWFVRRTDADGVSVGAHDFEFCLRARRLGFRVWAHYGYPCEHHKTAPLVAISQAIVHRRELEEAQ